MLPVVLTFRDDPNPARPPTLGAGIERIGVSGWVIRWEASRDAPPESSHRAETPRNVTVSTQSCNNGRSSPIGPARDIRDVRIRFPPTRCLGPIDGLTARAHFFISATVIACSRVAAFLAASLALSLAGAEDSAEKAAPVVRAVESSAQGGLAGNGLAGNSPFLPAHDGSAQSGPSSPYELRGIMSSRDGTRYYIYDGSKHFGAWVELNETGYPFEVSSADPANNFVDLSVPGAATVRLRLRDADEVAAAEAPQPANSVPAPAVRPKMTELQERLDMIVRDAEYRKRLDANPGQP